MRGPSDRVLSNCIDIYVGVETIDADRAPQYTFPTLTYPGEPCTIQPMGAVEDPESQLRVSQIIQYKIIFGRQLNLIPRAMILWVDITGSTRTLYIETGRVDNAGRGAAFTVIAQERL